MRLEKIKDMLKDKRNMAIAGAMIGVSVIVIAGCLLLNNKVNEKSKVEDNKVVTVNKEDTKEKEVKKELEDLNKIDISKLSEEDKKSIEDTKKLIEEMISNKEYDKARRAIDSVKTNIDNKFNEIAEKEKEEVKEENNVENVEANKEIVSNTTNSTLNNTSGNNSQSVNNSGSNSNSNQVQESVQQPTTPPVVEEKPVQSTPTTTPESQPPVVEESKPVYPSVAEVKQRLISYGQSLGYTYNPALEYNGLDVQGTSQMWGEGLGGIADGKTLFGGMEGSEFGITVVDLGNGYVEMTLWVE